ncbi:C-C motif chemokine 3-like [Rhinophrynus dorsalis]
MQISMAALSLLLLTACCSQVYCGPVGMYTPTSCCFKFAKKMIPLKHVEDYFITSSLCSNPGVIFLTKKGIEICANPSDKWVNDYKLQLDKNVD